MKRFISIFLLVLTMISLCSCGQKPVDTLPDDSNDQPVVEESTLIRIASLKGPTSMGLVGLYDSADQGKLDYSLEYSINGAADEITPLLINGDLDAAAVPANLASVLYNKTQGKIVVAAINTLGVLYVIEQGNDINSVSDLAGKTIYTTGKGTTPEYALDFVLENNNINPETDVTIEFASEATEVSSLLAQDLTGDAVAVLPQPYVTAALAQNDSWRVALSLADEWDKITNDSKLITGVLVFNKEFAESNPNLVSSFLNDYASSVNLTSTDPDTAASLIEQYGIVAKAPIAKKALPFCNITLITGSEMKQSLSGYLNTLFDKNPASVGGTLPLDDFYYGE